MKRYNYKQITIHFLLGLCLAVMSGCNDFLDIEPVSTVSPESYLNSEDQLAAYIINYYGGNQQKDVKTGGQLPSFTGYSGPYLNEALTDNGIERSGDNKYVPGLKTVSQNAGYWDFTNIYALNYYLQNAVQKYETNSISGNDAAIRHYIGEGYVLRAHEYFFRLRYLGDFPIITTVLPDNKDSLILASKRYPRNEVARFIISDLDKAIDLMNNNPSGGKVRLTKNVALLLKARVALFEATWEKYHAGTALVPNGTGWPGANKDYNQDYQFPAGSLEGEIDWFLDQAMDASQQVADAVSLTSNNYIIRSSLSDEKNPYYDMFACKDPSGYPEVLMYRAFSQDVNVAHSYNLQAYYGGNRGFTHQFEQSFLMQNGLPVYAEGSGYAGDDYIADTKIDRDWRWRLFMKAPGEVRAVENVTDLEYYPEAPGIYSTAQNLGTSTGYIYGKGNTLNFNYTLDGRDETAFVCFRAAEAYLIYMEASYLKKGMIDAKADQYWRALRERAGIDPDYNKTITATDMSKEALNDWGTFSHNQMIDPTLYNIRRERRCEFVGEGRRWEDLIRWRALDQVVNFHIEGCKVWGPMQSVFAEGLLLADQADEKKNTVSSPALSPYFRVLEIVQGGNDYYNGLNFCQAHYLEPISVQHFLITSPDGQTIEDSPIYQNPGWPVVAGEGADASR